MSGGPDLRRRKLRSAWSDVIGFVRGGGAPAAGPVLAVAVLAAAPVQAEARPPSEGRSPWSLTVYGGPHMDERFLRIITLRARGEFTGSYLVALAGAREVGRIGDGLRFEAEGQLVRHFGHQHHWELNALLVARWASFPWDRQLDTSIAVGDGLSYATQRPPLERSDDAADPDDNVRLVNYLMVEIELGRPAEPSWRLVGRVHHRSPIFGLFGEASGSNFLTLGIRRRF